MKSKIRDKINEIGSKIKETERKAKEDKKSTEDFINDAVDTIRQKQKEYNKK